MDGLFVVVIFVVVVESLDGGPGGSSEDIIQTN